MTDSILRALAASTTVLAYAALCFALYWRERKRHAAAAHASRALSGEGANHPSLVLFASQTGQAEALAWQTADWLHEGGTPVRVMPLNEAGIDTLREARHALFIASTYGEGDAPDGASVFAEQVMGAAPDLRSLRYSVLAMGDRQYANFCGFGRALDGWLQQAGARCDFERIEVDNSDPATIARWKASLTGDISEGPEEIAVSAPLPWRLAVRTLMNSDSAGAPVYHLAFTPSVGHVTAWASGDIAQISIAADPDRPRDYSIASIQADGELQLLVRQEQHPDGTLGAASGLLTATLSVGDTVALRVRPHRNFRLEGNEGRPLILIGNGTGLAGLRGHLRARAAAGRHENWLLFGERNAQHDFLYRDEIEAWQASGVLHRLDMVFSRDQAERFYVQHRLLQASEEVLDWIARGAAIYVCGSLQGMASGVDASLRQLAGDALIRELTAAGRYRRDVY
jgi:sulfite reductase (NADPH) flavoprotein alpha-component